MEDNPFGMHLQALRATDDNSLLRLFDAASDRSRQALPRYELIRVGKAIQRITLELRRRKLS